MSYPPAFMKTKVWRTIISPILMLILTAVIVIIIGLMYKIS